MLLYIIVYYRYIAINAEVYSRVFLLPQKGKDLWWENDESYSEAYTPL